MRRLTFIFLTAFCLHAPEARATSGFLQEIDDVPVPEGFKVDDEPLVYDTPSGRIVETSIEGKGKTENVKQFYLDTLPQLGWKQDEKGRDTDKLDSVTMSFEKEDEKIDMTLKEDAAKVQVKFSLYPAD